MKMSIKIKSSLVIAASSLATAVSCALAVGSPAGTAVFWTGFGVAVIGSVVGSAAVGSIVDRPISELKKNLLQLNAGDSTKLAPSGSAEIAELEEAINLLVENIGENSEEISGCLDRIKVLSKEFSKQVRPDGSKSSLSGVEQVVGLITDMTNTVQEVANNANTAAKAARDANSEADSGKQVVDNVTNSIHSLADEVERAANAIQKLEADSESIGAILEVIRGIADQTNLLALNAAIEAARAGEQGRGFAVVADEVRTLAQRTQEATEEINDMIARLQEGSSNAVKVMAEGRKQAELSVEQASKAGASLSAITAAISSISEMNEHIADAVESQTSSASNISHNLTEIRSASESDSEKVQSIVKLAGELDNAVIELDQVVRRLG